MGLVALKMFVHLQLGPEPLALVVVQLRKDVRSRAARAAALPGDHEAAVRAHSYGRPGVVHIGHAADLEGVPGGPALRVEEPGVDASARAVLATALPGDHKAPVRRHGGRGVLLIARAADVDAELVSLAGAVPVEQLGVHVVVVLHPVPGDHERPLGRGRRGGVGRIRHDGGVHLEFLSEGGAGQVEQLGVDAGPDLPLPGDDKPVGGGGR